MKRKSSRIKGHPPKKRLQILGDDEAQNNVTLSDDVIEHIISLLPLKEASQTSILSKRFEMSWQFSKNLCFDFSSPKLARKFTITQVETFINRVIENLACEKVETFRLCLNNAKSLTHNKIHLWLGKLFFKHPIIIDLDFLVGRRPFTNPIEIPFDVLDNKSIETLKLTNCEINLPSKFQGLHFLRFLVLKYIKLEPSFIKTVIDNCGLLESLEIVKCVGLRHMKVEAMALNFFKILKIVNVVQLQSAYVDAPTLNVFHFIGNPRNFDFGGKMTELRDVMLNFGMTPHPLPRNKLKNLMINMSHVRVLTITSTLLEVHIFYSLCFFLFFMLDLNTCTSNVQNILYTMLFYWLK
ncbi:putative FBD-associated F-box protein At1g61330 [Spinacia oleracea]|uniref:FBD-associated F-box protein At1g61330 n=1 Tax=Spinacia oleracea TaxID=3562 RepID=A0ABM3R1G9_SPIOL|nr:putative FBD-associated F-box protein At1g61330 [Spinacia oleracea]